MNRPPVETWGSGGPYDRYVGRWSREIARAFLEWLAVPGGRVWGDVGCGTGALVERILSAGQPRVVHAIDRAPGFLGTARANIADARAGFGAADATALPWAAGCCDVTVSGLVLNFVPDAAAMVRELARVTRPGGQVALYVWDYSGGMQMMRHFWDVAIQVSPQAATLDQAERFPICHPEPLRQVFQAAGLGAVAVRPLEVPTIFRDFDDYWTPFLGKVGPAPTYLAAQNEAVREQIRQALQARLPAAADGAIHLSARAWAVRGVV